MGEWEDLIPIPCARFQHTHSHTHSTEHILSSLEPVLSNIGRESGKKVCVCVSKSSTFIVFLCGVSVEDSVCVVSVCVCVTVCV